MSGSEREVIRMLRKLMTFGALALVALAFGVGAASAKPGHGNCPGPNTAWNHWFEGFSDGRFGN
jgi:hypothetical protein